MKKWTLILFVVCGSFTAGAQVQFGLKAGLNVANLTTSGMSFVDGASFSTRTDFNGGLMASIPLFSGFFLQPELLYSGQGQSFSNPTASGTINYDYLNLPVLFKYQHASGLFAETGPQIGFLLSSKGKVNGNTYNFNESQSIDFSWAFGMGYKLKTIPVGIDLRYNLGLNSIYKQAGMGTAKNSVFQFDLFYLFNIK